MIRTTLCSLVIASLCYGVPPQERKFENTDVSLVQWASGACLGAAAAIGENSVAHALSSTDKQRVLASLVVSAIVEAYKQAYLHTYPYDVQEGLYAANCVLNGVGGVAFANLGNLRKYRGLGIAPCIVHGSGAATTWLRGNEDISVYWNEEEQVYQTPPIHVHVHNNRVYGHR